MTTRWIVPTSMSMPVVFVALTFLLNQNPALARTERGLIEAARLLDKSAPVYFLGETQFSARFYSEGRVQTITREELVQLKANKVFVAVPKKKADVGVMLEKQNFTQVSASRRYRLFESQ